MRCTRGISAGDGAGPAADRAAHGGCGAAHRRHADRNGCTGKGNDQVRFDVATTALAPDLKVIAPIREWKMSREEEIRYAAAARHPVRSARIAVQHG